MVINKTIIFIFFILLLIIGFIIKQYYYSESFFGGYELTKLDKDRLRMFIGRAEKNIITNYSSTLLDTEKLKLLTKHIIGGKKEDKSNKTEINWYKYTSWKDLAKNKRDWNQYISDRTNALNDMLFNWEDIISITKDIVSNDDAEYIGIIRYHNDKKTLYIHSMESSNERNKINDTYIRGISDGLVHKYTSIPGSFLFHTHPCLINSDPFPSDVDIFSSILHSYSEIFFAECVISEYGIIIYFVDPDVMNNLKKQGDLSVLYYAHNIIMAWNSIDGYQSYLINDRLNLLNKFGYKMIIIPSNVYISDQYSSHFVPDPLSEDKFIKTKHQLLKYIENIIKEEERKTIKKK